MLMMARKRLKRSGKGSQKVRVEFRRNRAKPARDKTWTRLADDNNDDDQARDTLSSERVAAKGKLSRRRTVIVSEDGATPAPDKDLRTGTVVAMLGRIAQVDEGERIWPCSIRRVLRTRSIRGRNAVTVGDRVRFGVPINRVGVEVEGVIESVEPRYGELKRVVGRREHTVVANVDQAIIVSSADLPKPKPHLVDRYIVSALHGGITPIICLNKIDLVSAEELAKVDTRIRNINPTARIYQTQNAAIELDKILNIGGFDFPAEGQFAGDEQDPFGLARTFPGVDEHDGHSHSDSEIASVGITLAGEIDRGRFVNWLQMLLIMEGMDVMRAKGILNLKGSDKRHIFQSVFMMFDGQDGHPWGDESRINKMVFIGRGLDRQRLEEGVRGCLV